MATRLIADDIIAAGEPPRLLGGRHSETGRIVFPRPVGSEAELYAAVPLSNTGTLWSWTVQRFRPKSPPYAGPDAFEPFAMGYVELPGEIIVAARIVDIPFEQLKIGMPLSMSLIPFSTDPDGTIVMIYAFGPAQAEIAA